MEKTFNMNIQEIKEAFPDSEIKEGDMGLYIEVRLKPLLYLTVYNHKKLTPDLNIGPALVNIPYVQSIDDIIILYQLFNGET